MGKEFPLIPQTVPRVTTANRRILTQIPVPESIPLLTELREHEPRSMGGQPPIIWATGNGCLIQDPYGNQWIDFSAGVLVAATGYGHPDVTAAMEHQISTGLVHTYGFPNVPRIELVKFLATLAPPSLSKVFLLSTGAEATECAIKLARTYAISTGQPQRQVLVTFSNDFHGRTLGAQLAGGAASLKTWIPGNHPQFVQVPFPDGFRTTDVSFALFERSLADQGVDPGNVYSVMVETYQGVNAQMFPPEYARALREWCDNHGILLIFDEVQAGFGRTGKWFGFEHLGVLPDLMACGKGLSGGMPLSAVIGREDVLNLYGPGEMTSTHSGNALCCAATLANLQAIKRDGLVENAARLAPVLAEGCDAIMAASQGHVGKVASVGLVGAIQFVTPNTTDPDPDTAWSVVKGCVERGLMLFAPVGVGGGAVKINPPLIIDEEMLREGLAVLLEVVTEVGRA